MEVIDDDDDDDDVIVMIHSYWCRVPARTKQTTQIGHINWM